MPAQIRTYFLAGLLFIVGLGLGFALGKQQALPAVTSLPAGKIDNNLYSSQNAFIRGQITKIDGSNLTVTNLNNNTTGNVTVSDRVVITKPGGNNQSLGLSALETGKEVLINLAMVDGKYQAVSIQYVNPAPSLPPVSSIKPKTQPAKSPTP